MGDMGGMSTLRQHLGLDQHDKIITAWAEIEGTTRPILLLIDRKGALRIERIPLKLQTNAMIVLHHMSRTIAGEMTGWVESAIETEGARHG